MPNVKPRIGILYWGKRGGGKVLADQLVDQAQSNGINIQFFGRPIRKNGSGRSIPIFWFWHWVTARRDVINHVLSTGIEVMILSMASPWDLFLGRKLKRHGVQVTRIIHDASTHPGDIFPPPFWIKKLCQDANIVVALSDFVASQLIDKKYVSGNLILVGKLPRMNIRGVALNSSVAPRNHFLFIGRGRAYKGLDNLLSAWPIVGDQRTHLTIAGEGHKVDSTLARITHIDRWLSDSEVLQYIGESDLVILPYVEASQSGIIPMAHSLHRPVIVTPVGGLAEQVIDGIDGLIAKGMDVASLVEALNKGIDFNFDFSDHEKFEPDQSLLMLCISKFKSQS